MASLWGKLFGGTKPDPTTKPNDATINPAMMKSAYAVVQLYGRFVEEYPHHGQISDETLLPLPKKAILNASLLVLAAEEDQEVRNAVYVCASMLPYFQPNVGKVSLSPTGVDMAAMASLWESAKELGVEIDPTSISDVVEKGSDNKARHDCLLPIVEAEKEEIKGLS